jgi:hypothetical protein
MLMKIDIAKAFDLVSWSFLLEVLQYAGFSGRWRDWMMTVILSKASSKILLNGRPWERIYHARGLRQGDPLSPMLFILSIEVLNALIHRAKLDRLFSPLGTNDITFRASFYADDMVIFIKPTGQDFLALASIMETFEQVLGLRTNKNKSMATSINCSDMEVQLTTDVFDCTVEPFLCRYLGVPLSFSRLYQSEEQFIVDVVARCIQVTFLIWLGDNFGLYDAFGNPGIYLYCSLYLALGH